MAAKGIVLSEAPLIGFNEGNRDLPEAKWLSENSPANRFIFPSQYPSKPALRAQVSASFYCPIFFGAVAPGLVPIDLHTRPPEGNLWILVRRDLKKSASLSAEQTSLLTFFERNASSFQTATAADR